MVVIDPGNLMRRLALRLRQVRLRSFAAWLLVPLVVLLHGCAQLPTDVLRPPSAAMAPDPASPLAQLTRQVLPADDRSGFRLQPYGPHAFATRLALAGLATRSLDVQYYLLQSDNTGRSLMRSLRDAAARGVRVRVLVDDLYTAGEDTLLLALAAHPNVEVRLFNPFPAGRGSTAARFLNSAFDFHRVNRRMHNKLFIADGVTAVAGGRNMADEYVMNASGSNFIDMDVFVAGPVVRALSDAFDHYWNSEAAFPVASIAHDALARQALQADFERLTANATPPKATRVRSDGRVHNPYDGTDHQLPPALVRMLDLPFELEDRKLSPLLLANARVIYDPLTKTSGFNEIGNTLKGTVTEGVLRWMRTAKTQIKMVSPYFIPSKSAVANLTHAQASGVQVEVVTNSLASTDEPLVYGGYQPTVMELLRAGVAIRELSPSLSVKRGHMGIFGDRLGALHMKNIIVDDRAVFLGSMNLDPRSAHLNTEMGLIIDSEEMAHELLAFTDRGSSYALRIDTARDAIEWVRDDGDGRTTVFTVPPETTAWQRFKLKLISPFVPLGDL
ncbi:phospholipase D family protein [Variovorax sp. KK3]|uniref:phospholipase D family protein n=1 Tax=Variovorax sp. KK3 TaxID=1855728 RepID=UPI002117E7CB|nr:phospholipase D family protein [Variovorax sp. KK3]